MNCSKRALAVLLLAVAPSVSLGAVALMTREGIRIGPADIGDDANAGWKGRGLWITSGDRTPFHHEGGKTNRPLIVHIQIRSNPLAD